MADKKLFKGAQINHAMFQGPVVADPVFSGEYAFLTIDTEVYQTDANGQGVRIRQDVPLMVEPGNLINVVKNHIKKDRQLMAWCHYKTWEAGGILQHAFVVRKFDLGNKPYDGPTSNDTPPLP